MSSTFLCRAPNQEPYLVRCAVPLRSCDIYIKRIGVEPLFRLTDHPAQEYNPVWSPDGKTYSLKFAALPGGPAAPLLPAE